MCKQYLAAVMDTGKEISLVSLMPLSDAFIISLISFNKTPKNSNI